MAAEVAERCRSAGGATGRRSAAVGNDGDHKEGRGGGRLSDGDATTIHTPGKGNLTARGLRVSAVLTPGTKQRLIEVAQGLRKRPGKVNVKIRHARRYGPRDIVSLGERLVTKEYSKEDYMRMMNNDSSNAKKCRGRRSRLCIFGDCLLSRRFQRLADDKNGRPLEPARK